MTTLSIVYKGIVCSIYIYKGKQDQNLATQEQIHTLEYNILFVYNTVLNLRKFSYVVKNLYTEYSYISRIHRGCVSRV